LPVESLRRVNSRSFCSIVTGTLTLRTPGAKVTVEFTGR